MMFQRNMSPPSSGSESKICTKPASGSNTFLWKCQAVYELHDVTAWKTIIFIVNAVKIRDPT
jgi:hypothetical protein